MTTEGKRDVKIGVVFKPNIKGGDFLPLTRMVAGETPDEVARKLALLADKERK